MFTKISLKSLRKVTLVIGVFVLVGWNCLGLGGEYPNERPVNEPSWPAGMGQIVNGTNRVGGFFVNAEDIIFFSGSTSNFNAFLAGYSTVNPIAKHCLILHEGTGEAFSLGGGNRRPCDWKLYGCPGLWHYLREAGHLPDEPEKSLHTNYVLEVHFWTGGKIALDQVVVPKNVEVSKAK